MKLAKFKIDVTPPDECAIGFGLGRKTDGCRDPLWFRGIILDDNGKKLLIASIDYCGLMNRAHDELVSMLANAVNTWTELIIIHCIHQHDAPLVNLEINDILDVETFSSEWWRKLCSECAAAAKKALKHTREVKYTGYAERRLHGYASNRRVMNEDGSFKGTRYSRCADEKLKKMPVGTIDPFLRTAAFLDEEENILASMSFYATHPQVANGRNLFSADAPGEAMRLLEIEFSETFPCFFTGAGGNVTAGKYASPDDLEGNLIRFGKILSDGISGNLKTLQKEECRSFDIISETFDFPRKAVKKLRARDVLANENEKLCRAVLQSCDGYKENSTYRARMFRCGNLKIVFLPGEPFVEYQLYLQSLLPDEFIALAGNCSDNFLYLPLAKSFDEGGYEPRYYCWCTLEIEKKLKNTLKKLTGN
ncbi:MAG: hypothetical protein A2017_00490 [Lentisphaerae bacterium GWF2_44_16]|nr:MAG: hypothetical protein A2017_00490 [Lentisphaerae bacterium GWF2_44_16]